MLAIAIANSCGCCAELAVAIVVNLASGLALRIEPVLNQGDRGENLMPPSLFLIPDVPDVPEVPWVPIVKASSNGHIPPY